MTDKQVFPGFMKVLLRSIEFIRVICYKINCTALEADCSITARQTSYISEHLQTISCRVYAAVCFEMELLYSPML